ncbi:hypothetical protein BDP27DRAFT_1427379 [Rhodocollybia butyracea]|uniref:Uncharacterized protein n=1 Tax=Rhodocollybia butyracea TaxID=206335 RepID=A0A9P5PFJ5_9AGAR|nr:hypothetical protein BDP27DRAFT_1427379 [Rhodocollybia butyracea]
MRSVIILCAIIASSMLTVCAIPVPGPGETAESSKGSGAKRLPDQLTGPNKRPKNEKPKPYEVTFVDKTGKEVSGKETSNKLPLGSVSQVLSRTTGLTLSKQIKYTNLPQEDFEQTSLYFLFKNLEGSSKTCKESPCVGLMTRRTGWAPNQSGTGARKDGMPWYCIIYQAGGQGPWVPLTVKDFGGQEKPAKLLPKEVVDNRQAVLTAVHEQFMKDYKPGSATQEHHVERPPSPIEESATKEQPLDSATHQATAERPHSALERGVMPLAGMLT